MDEQGVTTHGVQVAEWQWTGWQPCRHTLLQTQKRTGGWPRGLCQAVGVPCFLGFLLWGLEQPKMLPGPPRMSRVTRSRQSHVFTRPTSPALERNLQASDLGRRDKPQPGGSQGVWAQALPPQSWMQGPGAGRGRARLVGSSLTPRPEGLPLA